MKKIGLFFTKQMAQRMEDEGYMAQPNFQEAIIFPFKLLTVVCKNLSKADSALVTLGCGVTINLAYDAHRLARAFQSSERIEAHLDPYAYFMGRTQAIEINMRFYRKGEKSPFSTRCFRIDSIGMVTLASQMN